MSETNFENLKISETEANRVKISNLSDRPNAMSTYGGAKKSASDLKAAFDKPFLLLVDKFNRLVNAVAGKDGILDKNEASRESAELTREEAEKARAAAEVARKTAEAAREADRQNYKIKVNEKLDSQDVQIAEFKSAVDVRLNNQDERMSQRISDSGIVTLMPFDWTNELTQTISIPDLGDDDLVIFYPASKDDRERCGIFGVFINPDTIDGVFTAVAADKPIVQITLAYYIIRGRLPEFEEVE